MKIFICFLALAAFAQANIDFSKYKPRDIGVIADIDFAKYKPRDISVPVKGVPFFGHEGRIVGGEVAQRHQFPYQVALFIDTNQGSFFCGGSLISKRYVLTAAHCVDGAIRTTVILGANRYNGGEVGDIVMRASATKTHENWNSAQISDDIAYVKLPSDVQTNDNIKIVTLPSRSDVGNTFEGVEGTISGWGKDSDQASGISQVLRFVKVNVISNSKCTESFGSYVRSTNICVDGTQYKGSCSGDSGGPFVAQGKQVGIVSYGSGYGCEQGFPSVFTRVTDYLDWLAANTDATIN